MHSIASEELEINPKIKIAVIYSIVESSGFLVELHYQGTSNFLNTGTNPTVYANLSLAKQAAQSAGALQGYQALENIYQEIGTDTEKELKHNRYEYIFFSFE